MDENRAPGDGKLAHEIGFDRQVPTDVDEQVKLLNALPALGIFILHVKPETNHFRTEDP